MRGSFGAGPQKVLDEESLAAGGQRWRFVSLRNRLDKTPGRPAALPATDFEANLANVSPDDTSFSHFAAALAQHGEENVTATFTDYVEQVKPLSLSLPLLFRNRKRIMASTFDALMLSTKRGAEATTVIAKCLAALSRDLGPQQFHPFFPEVVRAFASALDSSRNAHVLQSEGDERGLKHSTFWDPEVSLVPLFATLAEITKSHLRHLAAGGLQTVKDLLPLLANSHYRVREMTAEACFGFLLRKTRDLATLRQLVSDVFDATVHEELEGSDISYVTDGLGASLFEAVRLPSGRSHPRASEVLTAAFRKLGEASSWAVDDSKKARSCELVTLPIVARCMASLSGHLVAKDHMEAVYVLLINEMERATRNDEDIQAANVAFLMRKWLHQRGGTAVSLVSGACVQKSLIALSRCCERFKDNPRLVWESLDAIYGMYLRSSVLGIRTSSMRLLSTSVLKVSASSELASLSAAMEVVLRLRRGARSGGEGDPALFKAYSSLCEQIASLSSRKLPLKGSVTIDLSRYALDGALSFIHAVQESSFPESYPNENLYVPTLERQIAALLNSVPLISKEDLARLREGDAIRQSLLYVCNVSFRDSDINFDDLLTSKHFESEELAMVLLANTYQHKTELDKEFEKSSKEMNRVASRLFQDEHNLQSPVTLLALERYIHCCPGGARVIWATSSDQTEDTIDALSRNLSSDSCEIRNRSAAMLASFSKCLADDCDISFKSIKMDSEDLQDDVVDQVLDVMRKAFSRANILFPGVCLVLKHLVRTPKSLAGIQRHQRLQNELLRLVRKSKDLHASVANALINFSIGQIRTPLQPLWIHAAELWGAVAHHAERLAMKRLMHHVETAGNALLGERLRIRFPDSKPTLRSVDDESDDEDSEDLDLEPDGEDYGLNKEPAGRRRQSGIHGQPQAKRQRTRNRNRAYQTWDCLEWRSVLHSFSVAGKHNHKLRPELALKSDGNTDDLSFVLELLKMLCGSPKRTHAFRSEIVSVYLKLDPCLFSRRMGDRLATCFATLLEKMGGLKCCESNVELEQEMRKRLLVDLTRPESKLQNATLKCLCASRSPSLKPRLDSLIRLVDDSSFREELSALTESLTTLDTVDDRSSVGSPGREVLIDVLVRICFSKMKGKKAKLESRRLAVLSFIVSKLPQDIALPRITSLILTPMKEVVDERSGSVGISKLVQLSMDSVKYPDVSVQLGMLSSIESLLKQCRRSLPEQCWDDLSLALFALLRRGGKGPTAQTIRSRSLRIIAEMCLLQPQQMSLVVLPVLHAVKDTFSGRASIGHNQGAPAFLHFLSKVFRADLISVQKDIAVNEAWAVEWNLAFLAAEKAEPESVELALCVPDQLIKLIEKGHIDDDGAATSRGLSKATFSAVSLLAVSLRALLQRIMESIAQERGAQKTWGLCFQKSLNLVERLSSVSSGSTGVLVNLCEGLVSCLENPYVFSNSKESALAALTAIMGQLSKCENGSAEESIGSLTKAQAAVWRLLPLLGDQNFSRLPLAYVQLCKLFSSLGLPDFLVIAPTLEAMNAWSDSKLDSPDLDRRISGLNCVISAFKDALEQLDGSKSDNGLGVWFCSESQTGPAVGASCGRRAITALAYGCLSAVRYEDIAVRGTAGHALQLISKWVATSKMQGASGLLRSELFEILTNAAANAKAHAVRREYCRGLGELVRLSSQLEQPTGEGTKIFAIMRHLSRPSDLDSDFFENIVHLQAHRRGRALRQIEREVLNEEQGVDQEGFAAEKALSMFAHHFSLPLALNIALEATENPDKRSVLSSRKVESRESVKQDVVVWAVSLAGSSASHLDWPQYKSCLFSLLRRLKSCTNGEETKTLYKLLVTIVEAFPKLNDISKGANESIHDVLVNSLLPKMLTHITAGALEGRLLEEVDTVVTAAGQSGRAKSIPQVFRAPVAVAVANLMTRLQPTDVDILVPLLITPLTNALRSRMSAVRDSAKKALTSVVLILGPKYLPYVLRQVLSALKEGFRKDACVYVIHSLLRGIQEHKSKQSKIGEPFDFPIDGATGIISSYLCEELESGVTTTAVDFEDPNVSSARQKQASLRASRAFECAEMMAESINFKDSAIELTKPFEELILQTTSAKLLSRLDSTLERLVRGFSRNPSMNAAEGFKMSFGLIGEVRSESGEGQQDGAVMDSGRIWTLKRTNGNGYRLVNFGMKILTSVISMNSNTLATTSSDSRQLQAMLEPFAPLIIEALQTRHDALTLSAVRVSQRLLKVPLSCKDSMAQSVSDIIIEILSQKVGVLTHTDDLFNSCLRTAAVLIHEVGTKGFGVVSKEQIETVVTISCNCIDTGGLDARSAALAVLKAIVASREMIPAVYDAMQKVNRMAIRAQSASLRASCTNLSISFMVSFPLGSKRVRQHLEFFVRNLNYELPNGRLAALEALRTVVMRFPPEVLERECEYLFVALAASIARDSDTECRLRGSQALQLLFERVPAGRKITDMLKMAALLVGVQCSMSSPDDDLEKGSCESDVRLSGALALAVACKSGRLTVPQLGVTVRVLVYALHNGFGSDEWETAYGLLQSIETAFEVQRKIQSGKQLELRGYTKQLWESIPSLLLHSHPWVRLCAARLLGTHLSACGGRNAVCEGSSGDTYSILSARKGLVRSILKSCCLQLEAAELTEALGQQCLKNVLCMSNIVFNNPSIADVENEEADEQHDFTNMEQKLDAPHERVDENRGLRWLLARMSGLAIKVGSTNSDMLRRGCALRFLSVTTKWWGIDFIRSHRHLYIAPVVKILESRATDQENPGQDTSCGQTETGPADGGLKIEGLRMIATSLQDALVENLGATEYYEVYHDLRKRRDSVKQERKRKAALQLAADPEGAARKRRRKAEARKKKKAARGSNNSSVKKAFESNHKQRLTEDL